MSKPQDITLTEPSTPVEANHSARRTLKDRDNILHASQYADSTAPEGGYGWAVIFACFSISFWIVGTVYSWGVMQAALFKQGLSSPPTLSWIGSLDFSCIAFLALVNARVIRLLGARGTALLGISMLALGEILSGFLTHNVGGLFVTAGVVSGIGTRYHAAQSLDLIYMLTVALTVASASWWFKPTIRYDTQDQQLTSLGHQRNPGTVLPQEARPRQWYCLRRRRPWRYGHQPLNERHHTARRPSLDLQNPRPLDIGNRSTGSWAHQGAMPNTIGNLHRMVPTPYPSLAWNDR